MVHRRYDFSLLFDVRDGNPNGDPELGNAPRVDPDSGLGIVTDVSLKRRVRDYVGLTREAVGYDIYVRDGIILNDLHERAYRACDIDPGGKGPGQADLAILKQWMCETYYDVRTFGAVMATSVNVDRVKGPVQLTFGRSIDPISVNDMLISRVAVTSRVQAERQKNINRTFGRKVTIPYALYRADGFVSAMLAGKTGFSEDDLALLWEALVQMFEHDRSASRGLMCCRGLIVFEHASPLGEAPAHELFDLLDVRRNSPGGSPQSWQDYTVRLRRSALPAGVSAEIMSGRDIIVC